MEFIKYLIKKIIGQSSYKKNILIMMGGRILSQSIPILLTPIFSRMYSPQDYGVFAVFIAIVSLLGMISNGRYCLAIILPKEDEKAKKLVLISTIFTIFSTISISILLFFAGNKFFSFINSPFLSQNMILILLNIFFLGATEPLVYYGMRTKQFKIIAESMIFQSVLLIIIRIAMGYYGYTDIGLMISYLAGYVFVYPFLLFRLNLYRNFSINNDDLIAYRDLIKKYIKFPRLSLIGDTLGSLNNGMPNALLSKMFGTSTAGYYSMSDKVLGSPIWFITSSVGDVFKQEASEQFRNKGTCFEVFKKTAKSLFLIGIIPFLLLFFISPYLVPFIFGPGWEPVGLFIRIFSLMYFAKFVINPLAYVVYIVEKQGYLILFQTMSLISIIFSFALGYYYKDLTLGLIAWAILSVIANMIIFSISYKFARDSKNEEIV